ncbi:hypothetical protein M2189_008206 [Bradyrhizobium japonicum]|uniref:hypothetical protein n=1 Tax=Bradyrhizobium japonicum TaxID=375 RepID=UPI0021688B07|nr:hypothetical protein [Bradyrhizobium japonicum]MCS3502284.1 hypothetical protein [Bradyrhizobium japonicum]MCS3965003.1 hypothetical protein [Bradyrhizobium japonicum]MCS3997310.1 hypothetical protein [Bradyrhizobium japonicum]
MEQIAPSTLNGRLREYFAGHHYDGLFVASLDHSPTEQLVGEKWHTSALILSARVEHSALAHELGRIANPRTCKLTKWGRANPHYRKRFCSSLMSALSRHRVMVFAVSATESSIAASEQHFIKELGGTSCYRRDVLDGRARVSMGPFVNVRTGDQHTVELPGNQAPMVLFIAHFLRRIHQQMHVALSAQVTWNFFGDKPPAGAGGAFDNALAALLGLSNQAGQLRWGYFIEGDIVEIDLLADNVAGLLNEIMRVPQRYPQKFGDETRGDGLLYWERWTT